MNDTAFIVGGGPSLYGFDFRRLRGHDNITVNDSVFFAPDPVAWISMDYTWLLKNGVEYGKIQGRKDAAFFNKKMKRFFLVAFGGERLGWTENGIIDREKNVKYDLRPFDRVIHTSGYGGLGYSFDDFRSGSDSGFAAIQLAVVLGYRQIYLLGMDFKVVDTGRQSSSDVGPVIRTVHGMYRPLVPSIRLEARTHFHTKTSKDRAAALQKKLDEFMIPYPKMLSEAAAAGIRIFSCSKISKLNEFVQYVDVGTLV